MAGAHAPSGQLVLVRSMRRVRRMCAAPHAVAACATQDVSFKSWESRFANTHRRTDIKRIMILGAGPIVIGQVREKIMFFLNIVDGCPQACEFDYSGTQACKALR